MMSTSSMNVHAYRDDGVAAEIDAHKSTTWIEIKIGSFEFTIFAEDMEHAKEIADVIVTDLQSCIADLELGDES